MTTNSATPADTTPIEGFTPFSLDYSHPFYVHPSDSPGTQISTVPFDGNDFITWRKSMLISLSAKNKLGLIIGRNPKPNPESPYYPYWERCNDMVIAWIINSLSRNIAMSVIGFNTAKEIWEDLNDRFGQSKWSKYIQIQRELASTVQGSSDVATYFTKLRGLWDELSIAYVGPTCTCGALPKLLEEQKLFQFLSGLNETYSTCKSNILMMSPLSSLSKAYSMVQNDEKQKEQSHITPTFSNDSMSFHVSSGPQGVSRYSDGSKVFPQKIQGDSQGSSFSNSHGGNRPYPQRINFESKTSNNTLFCKYCKKTGHLIGKCHRLHGYPADFQFTKIKKSVACVQTNLPLPEHVNSESNSPQSNGFIKDQ